MMSVGASSSGSGFACTSWPLRFCSITAQSASRYVSSYCSGSQSVVYESISCRGHLELALLDLALRRLDLGGSRISSAK